MKRLTMLLGAAALAAVIAPATAQVDKKAKDELMAGYAKIVAALKKKDVKSIVSQMTPDVVIKENGQTMNKAQFEAMLKQQLPMMELVSSKINFTKVVVKGDTANAEWTEDAVASVPGQDGKKSKMSMKSKYKGSFKKIGGDWKMHTSESIGAPEMKPVK